MKVVGNKLMAVCEFCGKIIRVDKPIIGSLHFCTLPDERREYATEINEEVEWAKRQLGELS